jgi:hypothetical protein
MIQTPTRNLLFVSALVVGLLAVFPPASSGGPSTQINIGGIDFKATDSSASPSSSKIRERLQSGNAGATSHDSSNKLLDKSQHGKSATGSGGTTTSTTNGTVQGDEYGKAGVADGYGRPTSPFCSTTSITIGEEHRTTLHCPGGTLR